jgi:hypothetical protein
MEKRKCIGWVWINAHITGSKSYHKKKNNWRIEDIEEETPVTTVIDEVDEMKPAASIDGGIKSQENNGIVNQCYNPKKRWSRIPSRLLLIGS